MEFNGYGGYSIPHAMPDSKAEGIIAEFCMIFWVYVIVFGAQIAPFPMYILLWVWLLGMPICIPLTAWLGARNDPQTTMWREIIYFFRRGMVGMRIVGWPIYFLVACFKSSERQNYIFECYANFRSESIYIKHDTAFEMAVVSAEKIDKKIDTAGESAHQVIGAASEVPAAACRTTMVAATLAGAVHAQPPSPVTSIATLRTGVNLQSPHSGTYHLFEFLQIRGKWIYPDFGYIDFATNTYREFFAGAGRIFHDGKKATVLAEGYFVQAAGPASGNARYLWANPIIDLRFTPKLTSQTSYILYIPLNQSARIQHVIERSKLERSITKSWKAGGGYGAYQYGNGQWQNKPFVTTTFTTRAGSFEFWLQKMPKGAQLQLRYDFIRRVH